jgi:hypothetical protein
VCCAAGRGVDTVHRHRPLLQHHGGDSGPGGHYQHPQPRAVHAKLERFDGANRATAARDVLALPLYQENFAAPIATGESR